MKIKFLINHILKIFKFITVSLVGFIYLPISKQPCVKPLLVKTQNHVSVISMLLVKAALLTLHASNHSGTIRCGWKHVGFALDQNIYPQSYRLRKVPNTLLLSYCITVRTITLLKDAKASILPSIG